VQNYTNLLSTRNSDIFGPFIGLRRQISGGFVDNVRLSTNRSLSYQDQYTQKATALFSAMRSHVSCLLAEVKLKADIRDGVVLKRCKGYKGKGYKGKTKKHLITI
jgi:hypothetical protein